MFRKRVDRQIVVAAADIDNDGFVDIYRTRLTEGVMLRNNGNGTFSDVTAKTGSRCQARDLYEPRVFTRSSIRDPY